jgi:1-acyl-sn-glycerol-3-phosphate acyltransferase
MTTEPTETETKRPLCGGAPVFRPLTWGEVWRQPLPFLSHSLPSRTLCRVLIGLLGHRIIDVRGLQHLAPEKDPFIIALNHTHRIEAMLVPALLMYYRGGKLIHFLSDWNFQLIPIVASIIRRCEPIIVTRKSARPRFLNVLKPLFEDPVPVVERTRQRLKAGAPVGMYPEGTLNRNPVQLLRGYHGTARLSLETGIPVVPVGIRFPEHHSSRPIPDRAKMAIHIGLSLQPPSRSPSTEPSAQQVREWHEIIMKTISELSLKTWSVHNSRQKYDE